MPLQEINGLRVLKLSGTPSAMGAEHGHLLRDEIHFALAKLLHRSSLIFGVPYPEVVVACRQCEPFILPQYLEELSAIAYASGVPYEELLALNCLPDFESLCFRRMFHCCNIVVMPPATTGDFFGHGRNLDFPMPRVVHKNCAILIARSPASAETHPTLGMAWSGVIGMFTACNAHGISAGEVSAPAPEVSLGGVPIGFAVREMLEHHSSFETMASRIQTMSRIGGYNFALADAKSGTAIGLETTRSVAEQRGPVDGYLVVDDLCLNPRAARSRLVLPGGVLRHARATQLIQEKLGAISEETMLAILRDRFDLSIGEFRNETYKECNTICNDLTAQSVLFMLRERRMLISHDTRPAPMANYRSLHLDDVWD